MRRDNRKIPLFRAISIGHISIDRHIDWPPDRSKRRVMAGRGPGRAGFDVELEQIGFLPLSVSKKDKFSLRRRHPEKLRLVANSRTQVYAPRSSWAPADRTETIMKLAGYILAGALLALSLAAPAGAAKKVITSETIKEDLIAAHCKAEAKKYYSALQFKKRRQFEKDCVEGARR
jgi:hypothetical protein